jgi:AcrR family transcriptional regulator
MSTPTPPSMREAILDAAVRLFAERGPGVRLEDIADEAGVSRQSVYLHVGSRTGLMIAIVQHIDAQEPLPSLIQSVFEAPSALDALDAIVALHAEYHPMTYGWRRSSWGAGTWTTR